LNRGFTIFNLSDISRAVGRAQHIWTLQGILRRRVTNLEVLDLERCEAKNGHR
jgi:hypothetical protein